MKRIAQIINATSFVQALVRPSGAVVPPSGWTFIEIEDAAPDPLGKYYVNGQFQDDPP